MKIDVLIQKIVDFMPQLNTASNSDSGEVSFGILKAMMMVAAVDGHISPLEMQAFWSNAKKFNNVSPNDLPQLWKSALSSAGYLAMQAMVMPKDELVSEFLRTVDADFVHLVTKASHEVRKNAFKCLKAMAEADGDYSDIEKDCIGALLKLVREKWEVETAIKSVHL